MEMFVDQGEWVLNKRQKADYIRMYEYLIPEVLLKEDPDTIYWPASPSSGGGFDDPNDPARGDVHYWSVWHGQLPFAEYRKHQFRYLSEFGFESLPCMATVKDLCRAPGLEPVLLCDGEAPALRPGQHAHHVLFAADVPLSHQVRDGPVCLAAAAG